LPFRCASGEFALFESAGASQGAFALAWQAHRDHRHDQVESR
jgi:hypothetical protein